MSVPGRRRQKPDLAYDIRGNKQQETDIEDMTNDFERSLLYKQLKERIQSLSNKLDDFDGESFVAYNSFGSSLDQTVFDIHSVFGNIKSGLQSKEDDLMSTIEKFRKLNEDTRSSGLKTYKEFKEDFEKTKKRLEHLEKQGLTNRLELEAKGAVHNLDLIEYKFRQLQREARIYRCSFRSMQDPNLIEMIHTLGEVHLDEEIRGNRIQKLIFAIRNLFTPNYHNTVKRRKELTFREVTGIYICVLIGVGLGLLFKMGNQVKH